MNLLDSAGDQALGQDFDCSGSDQFSAPVVEVALVGRSEDQQVFPVGFLRTFQGDDLPTSGQLKGWLDLRLLAPDDAAVGVPAPGVFQRGHEFRLHRPGVLRVDGVGKDGVAFRGLRPPIVGFIEESPDHFAVVPLVRAFTGLDFVGPHDDLLTLRHRQPIGLDDALASGDDLLAGDFIAFQIEDADFSTGGLISLGADEFSEPLCGDFSFGHNRFLLFLHLLYFV